MKIKGIEYRKINLKNEFTVEMYDIAKPFVSNIITPILDVTNENDVAESGKSILKSSFNIALPVELVAIGVWENDEKEFDLESYKLRVEKFKKITFSEFEKLKEVGVEVANFITPSIMSDFQIYLPAITNLFQTTKD